MRYSLYCQIHYAFDAKPYVYRLQTTRSRSAPMQRVIAGWIARHRPGTPLNVRVNPAAPNDVVVTSDLPLHQSRTSEEEFLAGTEFFAAAVVFVFLGRRLRGSGRRDAR